MNDHQVILAIALANTLETKDLRYLSQCERTLLRALNAFIQKKVPS